MSTSFPPDRGSSSEGRSRRRPRSSAVLLSLVLGLGLLAGCSRSATAEAVAPAPAAAVAISPADPASLQRAFDAAVAQGRRRLVIPPGTYRLPALPERPQLLLENAADLVIDGTGATLVFASRDQHALMLRRCARVTVRGLRIERATPAFSQGVIERLEEDGRFCVVRLDPGYPQDIDDRRFFPTFWTKTFTPDRGRWLAFYGGVTPTEAVRLEPGLFRVRMHTLPSQMAHPPGPGTPLVWRGRERDDVAVRYSTGCTIQSVTVAGGAGMCFHEMGGGGNAYLDCQAIKGEPPPGASMPPLMASAADGFHSSGTDRGPRVERCRFVGIDDDAIAVHGSYAMVMEAQGERMVAWRFQGEESELYGKPGDTLRLYDEQGRRAGEVVIKALRRIPGYQPPALPEKNFRVFQEVTPQSVFVEFICDRPVPAKLNWLACNPGLMGSGYVIRDNIILDCFARGILPKAADGVIEGNRIERTARAAIELLPELYWWSESDYSTNVVIRDNVIRQVGMNRDTGHTRHPGAINIFAFRAGQYVGAPGGHQDLTITGNTIEDCDGPNMLVTSAQRVRIEGNRFVRPMRQPSEFGKDKGIDTRALIWCSGTQEVVIDGNRLIDPGAGLGSAVVTGPSAPATAGFTVERTPGTVPGKERAP